MKCNSNKQQIMAATQFHRHFSTKGNSLYWILIAYLVIGAFFPIIGIVALICMTAPVVVSIRKGRWWCGNACPRGNLFDRLISQYSPHKPIPTFLRSRGWRIFMLVFIFSVFGIQTYYAWGDWSAIGRVFWNIILVTTIAGVALAFIYAPRTWCSFCPMGTLSSWAAPRKGNLPDGFKRVHVGSTCQMKCKSCARVCPMQLTPYDSRGQEEGYLNTDCIKCGRCIIACPSKIMEMKESSSK